MIEIENNIYKRALNIFGLKAQSEVAIEEMAELIQAISKHNRSKAHNVEEEIADVEIMLNQIKLAFDEELIEEWKIIKLARLNKILDKLEEEDV